MKNSAIRQAGVINTLEGNCEDALLDVKTGEDIISHKLNSKNSNCNFWLGMVLSALIISVAVYFYLNMK
jgi:hypothetical protein